MAHDAFSSLLLWEIDEAASGELATASRSRLEKALDGVDSTDLQNLDLEKLLDVIHLGRAKGNYAYIENAESDKILMEWDRVSPEKSFISSDIDDRLKAAIIIIQKYPKNIPEMLAQLWGMHTRMQTYIDEQNLTPQSKQLSQHDQEVFEFIDIIENIASYATAKIPDWAPPTFETYLFSGNERDLRRFLADPRLLTEVYTHPDDCDDMRIQAFIRALKNNQHAHIVLWHDFPQNNPFIKSFLEALRA